MDPETESVSDNKHVKFSPRVKVINTQGGGRGPCLETTLKEIEHGSAKSSDSSDTSPSSAKAACEDIVQGNPQILPESTGGSNGLEESVKEYPEPILQLSDADHSCLVENMSPTISLSIRVMEFPEGHDPDTPAFIFDRRSTSMERDALPDDSLFSINIGETSFSPDDAVTMGADLNKSVELPKSGQSFRSGELCQSGEPSKSRELGQSGQAYELKEIHKSRECQSTENLKASDSNRSVELVRFHQTSPTTEGVEPNKNLDVAKTMSMDVKRGEKGTVGEPIDDVPKALMNNQADTNIGDSRCTSSKPQSERNVALPKKKKSLCKFCHCFKWPSCSSKLSGCSCKWIRWPDCSFKWFVWPCCSRNCLSWRGCCCKRPSNQFNPENGRVTTSEKVQCISLACQHASEIHEGNKPKGTHFLFMSILLFMMFLLMLLLMK
ncbi:hypothetical protein C2S53_011273 [Perilla frutescens var. hirtella]|uniref:Uncharacterized protein n=1 Tax=Perilla frutescens var. hirtella TaxID=608512 RepID=A0AAD4IWZ7_PERFH|nr:hypothetical protein C2S53_011273 [Perilla frutescens var. hirtella]